MRKARSLRPFAVPALFCTLLFRASSARALEPRYDHRDEFGPSVELSLVNDTVAVPRRSSKNELVPALRLSFGFDVSGEGDELIIGTRFTPPIADPNRERIDWALDARFRRYFGTEEWKTFLDVGGWAPLISRLAAGPQVGLGLAYDWSRSGGLYLAASFGAAFGQAEVVSFALASGISFRFQ